MSVSFLGLTLERSRQRRDYAYRRGISTSGQPRAQQVAFERAVKTIAGRKGYRDLGTACVDRVRQASHKRTIRTLLRSVFALLAHRDLREMFALELTGRKRTGRPATYQ